MEFVLVNFLSIINNEFDRLDIPTLLKCSISQPSIYTIILQSKGRQPASFFPSINCLFVKALRTYCAGELMINDIFPLISVRRHPCGCSRQSVSIVIRSSRQRSSCNQGAIYERKRDGSANVTVFSFFYRCHYRHHWCHCYFSREDFAMISS